MPLPKHGKTVKKTLKLDWDYPLYGSKKIISRKNNQTIAQAVKRALPREEAFINIAKDDKRPLLVLRECKQCNGTDNALLSSSDNNEDILVMVKWFHCVKLPQTILDESHAFHNLFNEKHPPHLFVSKWDGSEHIPLRGDLSRTELIDNLHTMLGLTYSKGTKPRVKELKNLLYKYDMLDEKIQRLEITIDNELENKGPRSKKLKKYRNQLGKALNELQSLKKKESELYKIKLLGSPIAK